MIKHKAEMKARVVPNLRAGRGDARLLDLFSPEESNGKTGLCAVVTLEPGNSIGPHVHEKDGELYFVLEGTLTVTENGHAVELSAGDASFATNGVSHSVENLSEQTARLLAVIIP